MKFTKTKMAASVALVISAGNAQAILTSTNTLSIQADAVTSQGASTATTTWIVSSDGPLVDSFFTVGGVQAKNTLETQYAFLYNGSDLTLTGAPQSNIATWSFYQAPGSIETIGTGISILSASGDSASLNMSGLKWNYLGSPAVMGTGAWSSGYTNGVGNLTCAVGSGCSIGSVYTLKYTATVPVGDPSALGAIKYYFELHGTVGAVPEASTYGMMLAGLGVIGVAVRRRRTR